MEKVYVITTLADFGDGSEVSVCARETLEDAKKVMRELVEEFAEDYDKPLEDDGFYFEDMWCEYACLDEMVYIKYEIHECEL